MQPEKISTHKNSKRVTIKRKVSMAESIQTGAIEFMSMSKKSIGSYYESKNSKAIGSGLSFAERDVLMPYLIDLPREDRQFMDTSRKFFESLATPVPYEDGIILEIGLELNNNEPVTFVQLDKDDKVIAKNIPINVMDYVRYRHAINHPLVASSLKLASGNPLIQYYVHNPDEVVEQNVLNSKEKDTALMNYLKIKEEPAKVDMLLTLLGIDPRIFFGPNAPAERDQELRKAADERPKVFNETVIDKMFEEKYLLQAMINANIVRRIGNQFIFIETNKVFGNTEEEALFFFKDPANSSQVVIMKGLLQEAAKTKVTRTKASRMPVGR